MSCIIIYYPSYYIIMNRRCPPPWVDPPSDASRERYHTLDADKAVEVDGVLRHDDEESRVACWDTNMQCNAGGHPSLVQPWAPPTKLKKNNVF